MENFVAYLVPLALVVNAIILVHCAGHFAIARFLGVGIDVVSIGLGPKLFGFRRANIDWKVGWIPFGGYVRTSVGIEDVASRLRKISVSLSGPAANILFFLIVTIVVFVVNGGVKLEDGTPTRFEPSIGESLIATIDLLTYQIRISVQSVVDFIMGYRESTPIIPSPSVIAFYESGNAQLLALTISWSVKFALINLIPFPKFDGLNIIVLLVALFQSQKTARLVEKWLPRVSIMCVVAVFALLTWRDLEHL